MYNGPLTCPRCKGTTWHRDEQGGTGTGVFSTLMTCTRCSERLLVRHVTELSEKCLVCRRWTLCHTGRKAQNYREWVKGEPPYPTVWKGGK